MVNVVNNYLKRKEEEKIEEGELEEEILEGIKEIIEGVKAIPTKAEEMNVLDPTVELKLTVNVRDKPRIITDVFVTSLKDYQV